MKKLFTPWFIIYCLCWSIIHLSRAIRCPIPFFNSYLTDFLFVPAVAHVCLWFTRSYILHNGNYCYPPWYSFFIACYASIVFECIIPRFSMRFTPDYGDVLAYFAGAFFNIIVAPRKVNG